MLKEFSDIVSRIRAVQGGLSTVEFARRLEMTQQTVDLYLKQARKPSLEFVLKVCSTFDVSADEILGLKPFTTNVDLSNRKILSRLADLKRNADQTEKSLNNLLVSLAKLHESI